MGEVLVEQRSASGDRREDDRGGRRSGDYVSVTWLAAFWGVSPNTVRRDIRKGALRAYATPGGTVRILLADAKRYGRPIE